MIDWWEFSKEMMEPTYLYNGIELRDMLANIVTTLQVPIHTNAPTSARDSLR